LVGDNNSAISFHVISSQLTQLVLTHIEQQVCISCVPLNKV
jgi:hypothetical protein